jgi:hypothetical protein
LNGSNLKDLHRGGSGKRRLERGRGKIRIKRKRRREDVRILS